MNRLPAENSALRKYGGQVFPVGRQALHNDGIAKPRSYIAVARRAGTDGFASQDKPLVVPARCFRHQSAHRLGSGKRRATQQDLATADAEIVDRGNGELAVKRPGRCYRPGRRRAAPLHHDDAQKAGTKQNS
ncbi:MAG: hypothetical protein E5Y31_06375 [Mesorhizobium sp.]|nr:MAG: hypothetical protein E5Y31_06375 [Mesorhizobium sp.]